MNNETILKTYEATMQDIQDQQAKLTELRAGANALRKIIRGKGLKVPGEEREPETVEFDQAAEAS